MSEDYRMIPDYKIDVVVRILAEKLDFNHKMMNIPAMWKNTRGAGVKVAILDTGLPNHVDLTPSGGYSFIPNYLEDTEGHGTHVGGIIAATANNGMGVAGIAPDVEDYYIAVLGGNGAGNIDAIVKGIRWAVDEMGVHIINMSLGIAAGAKRQTAMEEACNYAASRGVAIFAAAGNESGAVGQPAIYDSVIAIAAVNSKKEHASFSNIGPEVDFAAGGVRVYSTYPKDRYAMLDGTSMAAPAAAAVGALIQSDWLKNHDKPLSLDGLREKMRKIAFDVGPKGFDEIYGNGIPIFGRVDKSLPVEEDPDTTPVDVPDQPLPVQPDNDKGKGVKVNAMSPQPDCAYWKLWKVLIGTFDKDLRSGKSFSDSAQSAVEALAAKTNVVDRALNKS